MNKRDFWLGLTIGFWIGAILGTFVMVRAEHIETRPAGDGCNTCTKQGPGSWTCTLMGCIDTEEIADWERKQAAHEKESNVLACLAKMEAAMRAMEPFVSKTPDQFHVITDDLMIDYDTSQDKLRKEIEQLNKRDAAWLQWQAVKRVCWQEK